MQESFKNQDAQPASPVEFHNGEQLDLHAADPRLQPYEAVAGGSLLRQVERARELFPHEKIGRMGEKLDHFRLWEQELAAEDFSSWNEFTTANDFAQWEELNAAPAPARAGDRDDFGLTA